MFLFLDRWLSWLQYSNESSIPVAVVTQSCGYSDGRPKKKKILKLNVTNCENCRHSNERKVQLWVTSQTVQSSWLKTRRSFNPVSTFDIPCANLVNFPFACDRVYPRWLFSIAGAKPSIGAFWLVKWRDSCPKKKKKNAAVGWFLTPLVPDKWWMFTDYRLGGNNRLGGDALMSTWTDGNLVALDAPFAV